MGSSIQKQKEILGIRLLGFHYSLLFRGVIYRKHESTGYYMKSSSLHVDVYKFYHGLDEIPKNCLIHHDGKDENGNYDKEKNDIEYLILMTRAANLAAADRVRRLFC